MALFVKCHYIGRGVALLSVSHGSMLAAGEGNIQVISPSLQLSFSSGNPLPCLLRPGTMEVEQGQTAELSMFGVCACQGLSQGLGLLQGSNSEETGA